MKKKVLTALLATSMILSLTGCASNPVAGLFNKDPKLCVTMLGGSYSSVRNLFGDSVAVKDENDIYHFIDPATGENVLDEEFVSVRWCSDQTAKYVIGVQESDSGYISTVYDENFNAVYTYEDAEFKAYDYVNGFLKTAREYTEDGTTMYEGSFFDTTVEGAQPITISGKFLDFQIYNGNLYRWCSKSLTNYVPIADWSNTEDLTYVNYGEEDYMFFREEINDEGYVMANEYAPNGEGSLSSVASGLYNVNDGSFLTMPESVVGYESWYDADLEVGSLGTIVMITDQEYEEGEDDNRTFRLYDMATGEYVNDDEYLSCSACLLDRFANYTADTTDYYLVKFADEGWGYLNTDFEDLGVRYDDAASIQTISDEDGDSMNIGLVVQDGEASVMVDGTTAPDQYYTLNEKGKCVKSDTCPIGQINSSYYVSRSADGSTCYYAVTTDDGETYQLVAVSLVK